MKEITIVQCADRTTERPVTETTEKRKRKYVK